MLLKLHARLSFEDQHKKYFRTLLAHKLRLRLVVNKLRGNIPPKKEDSFFEYECFDLSELYSIPLLDLFNHL